MLALLSTFLLVAVVFFLVEVFHAHKFAPRYPTGAFTHHAPVYEPVEGSWIEPGVVAFALVILVLYIAIVVVSL